jgi:hypothetical protein
MVIRRSTASVPLAGVLLMLPAAASAHAGLASSDPAADAVLSRPPTEVVLTFTGELDPAGSAFTVTDEGGGMVGEGEVDLQVAERNVLRGGVTIDVAGPFEVRWTALSSDGHPEEGTFEFQVGDGSAPDTALPGRTPLWPVGVLLLLASVAAVARTARVSHR